MLFIENSCNVFQGVIAGTMLLGSVAFLAGSPMSAFAIHTNPGSYVINIGPGATEENAPFHYYPSNISIPINTVVTWFNADPGQLHTATSGLPDDTDAGSIFNSGYTPFQYFYSYKFDDPWNYTYFCHLHPWMLGTVSVNGQLMQGNNFEFSTGTGATIWNLTETDRNLMRFEPYTTTLRDTQDGTYKVVVTGSDDDTVFSEILTSGNSLNLEIVATGGNRSLYSTGGSLGDNLVLVNGAFHVEGNVQPDDYTIRVDPTAIDGRPVEPISDRFELKVTR